MHVSSLLARLAVLAVLHTFLSGTLSQNGCAIQGTFADGQFRLRQVDPVSHVLARELTGAWDGQSSCRRYDMMKQIMDTR